MSKCEKRIELDTAMKEAMRAKEKARLDTIRLILADIKRIENFRQRARLEYDAPCPQLKIFADIRRFAHCRRNKVLALDRQHRVDNGKFGHVGWSYLSIYHHRAAGGKVRHSAKLMRSVKVALGVAYLR